MVTYKNKKHVILVTLIFLIILFFIVFLQNESNYKIKTLNLDIQGQNAFIYKVNDERITILFYDYNVNDFNNIALYNVNTEDYITIKINFDENVSDAIWYENNLYYVTSSLNLSTNDYNWRLILYDFNNNKHIELLNGKLNNTLNTPSLSVCKNKLYVTYENNIGQLTTDLISNDGISNVMNISFDTLKNYDNSKTLFDVNGNYYFIAISEEKNCLIVKNNTLEEKKIYCADNESLIFDYVLFDDYIYINLLKDDKSSIVKYEKETHNYSIKNLTYAVTSMRKLDQNRLIIIDKEKRIIIFDLQLKLIKSIKIPNINYKFEILNDSSIVTSTSEGKIKIISNL